MFKINERSICVPYIEGSYIMEEGRGKSYEKQTKLYLVKIKCFLLKIKFIKYTSLFKLTFYIQNLL